MSRPVLYTPADIVRFLETCLSYPDLLFQVQIEGKCLQIILNVIEHSHLTYRGLAEILIEQFQTVNLPHFNLLLIQGRTWGLAEIEWQMEVSLPIIAPNIDRTRITPLQRKRYRNVMEELVSDEVRAQIEFIEDAYAKECFQSNQAIAYALNRLQPMYATSEEGWIRMRKFALNNSMTIVKVVKQAMQVVLDSPRIEDTSIYRNKPCTSALILSRLAKLMGKSTMRWRDLPSALQKKLDKNKAHYRNNSAAYEIRSYLKRSKYREIYKKAEEELYLVDFGIVEMDWFKVYMSEAVGDFLNTLEQVVYDIFSQKLQESEYENKNLNLDDLIAYALNRLPAMYATTEEGITRMRSIAKEQLRERIDQVVLEALDRVSNCPHQNFTPLPFDNFEKELDLALKEIRQMLNRTDISWENLDEVLKQEFVERDITIPLSARL